MEIKFKDRKIRDLCETETIAQKKLGATCARKLRSRLSDLEAVEQVSKLLAGNPHPLKSDRAGQFALNLGGGRRLVFVPAHDPCPVHEDGGIDWSRVTIVCIEYIGNYHD